MTNVAVFDLPSAYWPVAESVVRSGRSPEDVPGAVVEHLRALVEHCHCQEAVFAVEHERLCASLLVKSGAAWKSISRRSRLRRGSASSAGRGQHSRGRGRASTACPRL